MQPTAKGTFNAIFNAAKERALDHFIAGHIGFCDMCDIVEEVLARLSSEDSLNSAGFTLETVLEADQLARARADDVVKERTR